jgi:hypothetical protein
MGPGRTVSSSGVVDVAIVLDVLRGRCRQVFAKLSLLLDQSERGSRMLFGMLSG